MMFIPEVSSIERGRWLTLITLHIIQKKAWSFEKTEKMLKEVVGISSRARVRVTSSHVKKKFWRNVISFFFFPSSPVNPQSAVTLMDAEEIYVGRKISGERLSFWILWCERNANAMIR